MCKDIIERSQVYTRLLKITEAHPFLLDTKYRTYSVSSYDPYDEYTITTTTMKWHITGYKHLKVVIKHCSRNNDTTMKISTIDTKGWFHKRFDIDNSKLGHEYSLIFQHMVSRAESAKTYEGIKADVQYASDILNNLNP